MTTALLPPLLACLFLSSLPGSAAVKRSLDIQAPAEVVAGGKVTVTIAAGTEAIDGEEIGFLHAEYSTDEGKTWAQLCSVEKAGARLSHQASFVASREGEKAIVRARVAFRGGADGDVDYQGGAIQWGGTWEKWRWPPSKYAVVAVTKRALVSRGLSIQVPAEAAVGSTVSTTILASTDAGDGEQIGFLHAEYSIDEGKTWTQFCYAENSGAELSRRVSFPVNAEVGKAIVRVRAAFRGGAAGDVDHKGGAIQWGDSWQNWRSPAARYAIIYVRDTIAAAPPARTATRREFTIEAPARAAPGSTVSATIQASTDASDGEQIGIIHAEYSIDDGRTWMPFFYAGESGAEFSREVSFAVGATGGKAIVRVRVAFRGGGAGDVDQKGGAIQWGDSWEKWQAPAAKYAIIYLSKP